MSRAISAALNASSSRELHDSLPIYLTLPLISVVPAQLLSLLVPVRLYISTDKLVRSKLRSFTTEFAHSLTQLQSAQLPVGTHDHTSGVLALIGLARLTIELQ